MTRAMIEANYIAWKAAELSSAIAMSKGWSDAGCPSPDCVYRDEAKKLIAQIRETVDRVEACLVAPVKDAA
ncbi:hypothetical protein [Brevundimonas sp. Marseille-Q4549]|jgi:hypothetical protein